MIDCRRRPRRAITRRLTRRSFRGISVVLDGFLLCHQLCDAISNVSFDNAPATPGRIPAKDRLGLEDWILQGVSECLSRRPVPLAANAAH
jgi:hypothetical protein